MYGCSLSDAHEWINEIPTVPIYYLAKPQPRERAWQNQQGKKTLLSLTCRARRQVFLLPRFLLAPTTEASLDGVVENIGGSLAIMHCPYGRSLAREYMGILSTWPVTHGPRLVSDGSG